MTQRRWTLVATSLGFAVIQLDVSVVNVAIKPIGASLGGGVGALQWVVNAYTLTLAAFILTAGAIGDRSGAKRVFLAGFAVFTAGSASCALAPSLPVLIGARAAQGLGAGLLAPTALAVLNHAFPEPAQRARAVGLWAAGASTALAGGPVVGGVLTSAVGWRAIFLINVPLGGLGMALAARYAGETARARARSLDLPGQVAGVVCLGALAAATIQGAHGFTGLAALSGFGAAAVAGGAFILLESGREGAMLPLSLFRSGTFRLAVGVGLVVNVAFYGLIFVLSLFLQRAGHLSALQTGLAFAPATVAILAANLVSGRVQRRLGPAGTIAAGALLMAAGAGLLLADGGAGAATAAPELAGRLVAIGLGIGLLVPAMTASLLGSVPRAHSGVAAGALNSARQTGSLIGVALLGAGTVDRALWIAAGLTLVAGALALRAALPSGARQ